MMTLSIIPHTNIRALSTGPCLLHSLQKCKIFSSKGPDIKQNCWRSCFGALGSVNSLLHCHYSLVHLLSFTLAKQTTTCNIYKNIYLFFRRMLVWSRSNREVLESFIYETWTLRCKLDDGQENTHGVTTGQACVNSRISLSSVQIVGLILPSNSHVEIWTCLLAHAISSHNWPMEYATSAVFEMACLIIVSSGNNCHAVHRLPSSSASVCDCTVGF